MTGKVIRVDEDVYQLLKDHADPLRDTPNSVLRNILGLDEYSDRYWSYQARLLRLGRAAVAFDQEEVVRQIVEIALSYQNGAFGS